MFVANGIIGGLAVAGPDAASWDRRNTLTGAVVTRAAACSPAEAERAADAAAAAFPHWSTLPPEQRASCLCAAADRLTEATETLVATAGQELGAAPGWVRFNVDVACAMLRQAASLATEVGERAAPSAAPGMRYALCRRPAGVVLGLAPWNAAVTLAVRAVAAPLALGNTVVLKASELCPKTHETVVLALMRAGLPDGVLNFVTNAPEDAHAVVEALIAHPAVRRVNFTGSTRVGREIAVMAARHLKKCLLELSGKGTMIVLADADLDGAARAAAHGAFFNQGQVCMSTDRIVVEQAVAGAFVDRLRVEAERLRADLAAGAGPLGAVISPEAVTRLRGLIEDAVARGARLVTGGEAVGTAMQPTVLDHVAFGMRLHDEEVFGPVVGVIRVADADEAVTVANDSEFGLAASVFGADLDRARAVAGQIEAGIVHVNGSTVYDDPAMPFGGMKASGYGRFGGHAAVEEFTEVQWRTERDEPAPDRLGR
nr:aldehyde dehydrogenase family protein [Thetidibacter halocola]